jgi:hypothetical protein
MTNGGTLTVLISMAVVSWGQSSLIDRAAPHYQAVTGVIVHALTAGFFTTTMWCTAGGLTVTAIALLTGPCTGWFVRAGRQPSSRCLSLLDSPRAGED